MALTANLPLVDAPGNVLVSSSQSDLPRDSVANVTQVFTFDRARLTERVGRLSSRGLAQVDNGLRLALAL